MDGDGRRRSGEREEAKGIGMWVILKTECSFAIFQKLDGKGKGPKV